MLPISVNCNKLESTRLEEICVVDIDWPNNGPICIIMPVIFSERLPLPSIRSYCIISILIFVTALLHARNLLSKTEDDGNTIVDVFLNESFCLWAAVNIAYCFLFLFGKVIQRFVFGDLRVIEEQHLQEKFWNFVFYKVIFVFGIVNAQTLTEVMCWSAWFSMLGFWHMFGQLCKDRYDYLTSSPNTPTTSHTKLFLLLVTILSSSVCMAVAAYYSTFSEGWNIFSFMIAECALLGLKCYHIIFKYCIQMRDGYKREIWEGKAWLSYYSDLVFECLILFVDLVYHLHMLLWSNVFLSMASLVLYWNIRTIFSEIKKKLRKHRLYRKITKKVKEKFPNLTDEELGNLEDHCAICWEDMKTAIKLPCGHIFHQACLCSWLQQDTSCPTCRMALANIMGLPERVPLPVADDDADLQQFGDMQQQGNQRNHFFHFDGSRIANWFPSFSIEVFHGGNQDDIADQELGEMALQVHTMFPNIPHEVILNDLRRTHSSEATAENILEGNISLEPDREQQVEENLTETQNEFEEIQPEMQGEEQTPLSSPCDMTSSETVEAPNESAGESSDASNCVDYFDDSDRRHEVLSRRRHRFMTDARRRYVSKAREINNGTPAIATKEIAGNNKCQTVTNPLKQQNKADQEERRTRVLQAIERRRKQDQQQDISDFVDQNSGL